MNDKDSHLIWESYDPRLDNKHHRREVAKMKRDMPDLHYMRAKAKRDMGIPLSKEDQDEIDKKEGYGKVKNPESREIGEASQIEQDLNELVYKAAEHFEKFRGKADYDDIISHLESHFGTFFNSNQDHYSNADQVINYIEDGGFRQDLEDAVGLGDPSDGFDEFMTMNDYKSSEGL